MDPERVREARHEAGLSLAEVAGDEVSRTLIHFVEHGRTQPSQRVLALIARRTRKPISFFTLRPSPASRPRLDLADELIRLAGRFRQATADQQLTSSDREAMKLVELTLRQASKLTKSLAVRPPTR